MAKQGMTWREALSFSERGASRATVRRHYLIYRREVGLPPRCDNPQCIFHTQELRWNGLPLLLVVDHVNGVSSDNRPKHLRLLCPNCDAQLETRGGLNKGRVQISSGGYAIKRRDGKRDYTLVAAPGAVKIEGTPAMLRVTRRANA